MKFFVVDVNRDETVISEMKAKDGEYKRVANVQGKNLKEQAEIIAVQIMKHRPEKVFVDNVGYGAVASDYLKEELFKMGAELKDDMTVVYR